MSQSPPATLTLTPPLSLIDKSEKLDQLFSAMAKVQAELGHAAKSSDNPFFKSKYADLAQVLDTGREVCTKHGISVLQFPEGKSGLVTVLAHISGQYMSTRMEMRPEKDTPQGIGSCITYARRYAYSAVVGIASEDDDGAAASGTTTPKPANTYQKKTYPPKGNASSSPLKTLNR